MKNKSRIWLTTHLNVGIQTFAQKFYVLENYAYDWTIEE
jgi:hypothetical protein